MNLRSVEIGCRSVEIYTYNEGGVKTVFSLGNEKIVVGLFEADLDGEGLFDEIDVEKFLKYHGIKRAD